jgi:hypothetical protein
MHAKVVRGPVLGWKGAEMYIGPRGQSGAFCGRQQQRKVTNKAQHYSSRLETTSSTL